MDNYGRFALLYGRNQLNIVKIYINNDRKKQTNGCRSDGSRRGVGRTEYKGNKEPVRGKEYTHFYNLVMVLWVNN